MLFQEECIPVVTGFPTNDQGDVELEIEQEGKRINHYLSQDMAKPTLTNRYILPLLRSIASIQGV
jgi:hypothetical protein